MIDSGRNKKILFLSRDRFPPSRVDVSVMFGEELPKKGFKIDWILTSNKDASVSYVSKWKGHNVYVGKSCNDNGVLNKLLNRIFDFTNDLKVFRCLNTKEYDAVQVKDKFLSAIFCLLATRIKGVKFVYWLSYPYHEEAKEILNTKTKYKKIFFYLKWKYIDFVLFKIIAPNANHLFVQSDQMLIDLAERNINREKMTSVPMGVSVASLPKMVLCKNINNHDILYLGSLSKIRKLDFMIRVLQYVLIKFPEAKLIFLGAGEVQEDEEFLQHYAAKHNVEDKVIITGQMSQKSAWERVQKAAVCVSPIYPSPVFLCSSPTKLVEYLALGKATVANNILDQSILIEESGGGICVDFNENEFSTAICYLLDDVDSACEMGRKGRDYILKNRNYSALSDIVNRAYNEKILS